MGELTRTQIFFNFSLNQKTNVDRSTYYSQKQECLETIQNIDHKYEGKPTYPMIKVFDRNNKLKCSKNTVHHYMKRLGLKSITLKKIPI